MGDAELRDQKVVDGPLDPTIDAAQGGGELHHRTIVGSGPIRVGPGTSLIENVLPGGDDVNMELVFNVVAGFSQGKFSVIEDAGEHGIRIGGHAVTCVEGKISAA